CAYFLRQAGHTVTVVDRSAPGDPTACSYGNTGFVGVGGAPLAGRGAWRGGLRSLLRPDDRLAVAPSLDRDRLRWLWYLKAGSADEARRAGVMLEMKRRSLEILREICPPNGPDSAFTACGMVQAYRTPEGFAQACRSLPGAVADGVSLRVLAADELRALEPGVEFDIAGALYNEAAGFVHAPDFVVSFARTLAGMGVEVVSDSPVEGFDVSGRTVVRVRTARGDVRPGEVVLAAGTWSAALAQHLDIDLDLQPVKGYTVTVRAPANGPRHPIVLCEGTVALRPLGDQLRFGGDMALAGVDRSISRRRLDRLGRTVRSYLPALEPTETLETWAGLRPCTPDSLPFLGRAPGYDNVSIAAGHGHSGVGLAPVSGQLIAQLLCGHPTAMDAAPFRVDRYTGAPSWLRHRAPAQHPGRAAIAPAGGQR
ncbi:MAG: FAD-dependent oxidoreductase, partial [Pseudonocardiales bacterium]